jgi:protein-L-isoaspartate(D-aspartate) O-methyltransferase
MKAMTSSGKAVVTLPSDTQILITREFDAAAHLVYRASTEPELIKRWWSGKRGEVTSVEIDPGMAADAREMLLRHGFTNVRVEVGDGARGFGDEKYDAIVLTGSTPLLPERFFEQLVTGGRIFAVVGEPPVMTARLTRWEPPGAKVETDLFETVIAPLVNAPAPARFEF